MPDDRSPLPNKDVSCPLCESGLVFDFHEDTRRRYLRCECCCLVFVPPEFHLSPTAEKAEYDLHENSPQDEGYRRFLSRLLTPLADWLEPKSDGLDFGCGPGPTLSVMFEEAGHSVSLYDRFYFPDESPLAQKYDFVTASEVVEHFRDPRADLNLMWNCVRDDGWLGIMTKRVRDADAFAKWHYKNDPTHVSFFSVATFQWLANHWNADLTLVGDDVVLLQKISSCGKADMLPFHCAKTTDDQLDDAFRVLQLTGEWLKQIGSRQRIAGTTREVYEAWQRRGENFVVLAGETIVGVFSLCRQTLPGWGHVVGNDSLLCLRALATHPKHRGRDVGSIAIAHSLKLAGAEHIYLDCVVGFLPDYYASHGFEQVCNQVLRLPEGDFDIALMRSSLAGSTGSTTEEVR